MLLDNKVGIITGAGSGIGRASAVRMAKEGADLGLFDISEAGLEETKRLILAVAPDARVICLKVDVSSESQVKEAVESVTGTLGKLNVAFNNAGVIKGNGKVGELDTEAWEREFRINFFGAVYCSKYQIQQMLKNDEPGAMVFTSSVGGIIGTPFGASYCCSKSALASLARVIMCDYADQNIRANAVCPGQIDTPMYRGIMANVVGDDPDAINEFIYKQNPQRRLCRPEEVAAVVTFLLSDQASYINGATVPVDGGNMGTNPAYDLMHFKP